MPIKASSVEEDYSNFIWAAIHQDHVKKIEVIKANSPLIKMSILEIFNSLSMFSSLLLKHDQHNPLLSKYFKKPFIRRDLRLIHSELFHTHISATTSFELFLNWPKIFNQSMERISLGELDHRQKRQDNKQLNYDQKFLNKAKLRFVSLDYDAGWFWQAIINLVDTTFQTDLNFADWCFRLPKIIGHDKYPPKLVTLDYIFKHSNLDIEILNRLEKNNKLTAFSIKSGYRMQRHHKAYLLDDFEKLIASTESILTTPKAAKYFGLSIRFLELLHKSGFINLVDHPFYVSTMPANWININQLKVLLSHIAEKAVVQNISSLDNPIFIANMNRRANFYNKTPMDLETLIVSILQEYIPIYKSQIEVQFSELWFNDGPFKEIFSSSSALISNAATRKYLSLSKNSLAYFSSIRLLNPKPIQIENYSREMFTLNETDWFRDNIFNSPEAAKILDINLQTFRRHYYNNIIESIVPDNINIHPRFEKKYLLSIKQKIKQLSRR